MPAADLIVDASFVVDVCLSSKGFEPLAGYQLAAPALLRSEASCSLHQLNWRNALTDHEADIAYARLDDAPIGIHTPRDLYVRARGIAASPS